MSQKQPETENKLFGQFLPKAKKPIMAMVEITNRCNMACPICYSNASVQAQDKSIEEVRIALEQLLELTETPIPLQISGGEPTLHDELPQIVAMAKEMGYRNIEVISNGIRIAREPDYLERLKQKGLTAVYLQFDGLQPKTTLAIRGQDMSVVRSKAIAAIRASDLCATLAVVVTKGVNDYEIGDIINFATKNIDVVRAINFQSATRLTGRFNLGDQYEGYALSDLLELIEGQTGIGADTFFSEHLGHSSCNAMSLVFVVGNRLEPLFKYINKNDALRFLGADSRDKILSTFGGKKYFFGRHLLSKEAWKLIAQAAPIFGNNPYNVLKSRHLLIFAKAFMEKSALDPQRIANCCYAITCEKGVFSFCAYNNLHRFDSSIEVSDKKRDDGS